MKDSNNPTRRALMQDILESMNTMKRGMHLRSMFQDIPISRAQVELLFTIRHTQPVNFKTLAQHLSLTPGAISQLAEALEQHEYISRQTDPDDRRIQTLNVSAKGEALVSSIEKQRIKMMESVMQDLSDEELAVWLRVQQKMIQYFRTEQTKKTT